MKYYIISAAINLGILLIPIATPVLKQKLEEKKEKQTIVVDLKNSILEENKTKSTVDTDNNEESNGTAGLQKGNPQNNPNFHHHNQYSQNNYSNQYHNLPKYPKRPYQKNNQNLHHTQLSPQLPPPLKMLHNQ